jgi:predicted XRE-type DNA-binding protein
MKQEFITKWSNWVWWWKNKHDPYKAKKAFAKELEQLIEQEVKVQKKLSDTSFELTESQISELASIGSENIYLGAMDEGRLSYGGVYEIIKKYEEFKSSKI